MLKEANKIVQIKTIFKFFMRYVLFFGCGIGTVIGKARRSTKSAVG